MVESSYVESHAGGWRHLSVTEGHKDVKRSTGLLLYEDKMYCVLSLMDLD